MHNVYSNIKPTAQRTIDEVSEAKRTEHISNRTTPTFAYADDIAVVSKNNQALSKLFKLFTLYEQHINWS